MVKGNQPTDSKSYTRKVTIEWICRKFITGTQSVSSVYDHHVPICTPDNIWAWDGGRVPRGFQLISELLDSLWCYIMVTSQWDSVVRKVSTSQWHQCLWYPETAHILWPHGAGYCHAPGVTQDSLHQPNSSKGTIGEHVEVCATLQGCSFPDTVPNWSCWMKLQAV